MLFFFFIIKQVLGRPWCGNLGLWGCSRSSSVVLQLSLRPFSDLCFVKDRDRERETEREREMRKRERLGRKTKCALVMEAVTPTRYLITCAPVLLLSLSQCSCHSQRTAFPWRPQGCHISEGGACWSHSPSLTNRGVGLWGCSDSCYYDSASGGNYGRQRPRWEKRPSFLFPLTGQV